MANKMSNRVPQGPQRHMSAKMPKGGWKVVGRVLTDVLKNYHWSLLVVVVCIVVTSFTTLASTLFTRTLIDDYIVPLTQSANPDYSPLLLTLGKLGAILLVGALCAYLNSVLMVRVSQGTLLRLRQKLFGHMQTLPISYFDEHAHGDIMSVYTNDVDTLRQLVSQGMLEIFSTLITISITFVSMLSMSWLLTMVVVVMTFLMIYITRTLGNRSAAHFRVQQQALGSLNGYVEEMLTGQKVVKTFNHEAEVVSRFSQLNETLRSSSCDANRVANIVMPVNGNLGNLIYVICAVLGAVLALSVTTTQGNSFYARPVTLASMNSVLATASLSIGTLVSFLTLIKNFTRPVSQVSQQINSVVMAVAGAQRVYDLMDAASETDGDASVTLVNAEEQPDGTLRETTERTGIWAWKDSQNGTLTRQRGEVDFEGVDFGYVPEKQVLYDINLDTDAGQKVAFVGGTGAGKTTIINLINRFYDIQEGKILYDRIDIRRIHRDHLRRSLGYVLQETHLFSGTVMDNIRYGRLDATDEECRQAAELVNADDFIKRLSDGYDTQLAADGGNLSQGERQLLAIARTAIANPPALILDEATSSIDTRTERLVQEGMDHIMQGRSTFVIAHRLSTVRNADIIVVLDHGRIIEQGSHDELIEKKGTYYTLYTGNQID